MKRTYIKTALSIVGFFLCFCAAECGLWAASPAAVLNKAKQEAEAKGYIFIPTHEEIIAGAKKESKLRVLGSLSPSTNKQMISAFKKRYPFMTEVYVEEITGTDAPQRFLLELKAGRIPEWDMFDMAPDYYVEYLPYVKKFDILGMATQKVLAIPPAMIDPKNFNIVSVASSIHVVGYNKKLIAEEKVPRHWEDFLKPEFKGKKFMADIRPQGFAALAAGLGGKWTMDYAAKIAAQDPVWVRGQSGPLAAMIAGERALLHLAYYHSCMRSAKKDASGSLECRVIEPVPARLQEFAALANSAPHPYSALLWVEFQSSPEGQTIIDEYEPLNSSIYAPDSALAKVTQGKKLSVNNWETLQHTSRWQQMVFKTFGFPKAEQGN
jgi:ABC-type Fe3+ transport system substrate-binding protein